MSALNEIEKENRLLIDFLEGDAYARDEFPEAMMQRILKTARAIAKDLPEDIQEEIAQQTFQNLLFTPSANFNPARGTAWQFLIGQIWNAEKQVRAAYGFPQRRKTKVLEAAETSAISEQLPKIVSINNQAAINAPAINFERKFESEFFVKSVIRKAPPQLATALQLICFRDKNKEQSAKIVGLSRFQMHRQMKKLCVQLMAA